MKPHDATGLIYSFFGPPGSGKGTLAEQCGRKLGFSILSTGNLCRKHIASGTEFGKKLEGYLSQGKLVPDDLVVSMVETWLAEKIDQNVPIILDGFPRTAQQAAVLCRFLQQEYPRVFFKVVLFEVPDEVIVKRVIEGRMVCENKECQAVFSSAVPPKTVGKCDYCNAALAKRFDDNADVIKKRLQEFANYKTEILHFYTKSGVSIEKVDPLKYGPVELFDIFRATVDDTPFSGLRS